MGFGDWVVHHALSEFNMALHGSSIKAEGGGYTREPSLAEMDKFFKGSGGFPEGYSGNHKVHWCGVFATYILRKVCTGVAWQRGKLVDLSGGKNLQIVRNNVGMKAGDVAVRDTANQNHHFIVLGEPTGGQITSVDGNYGNIQLRRLFYGNHWKNKVSAVEGYYRLI